MTSATLSFLRATRSWCSPRRCPAPAWTRSVWSSAAASSSSPSWSSLWHGPPCGTGGDAARWRSHWRLPPPQSPSDNSTTRGTRGEYNGSTRWFPITPVRMKQLLLFFNNNTNSEENALCCNIFIWKLLKNVLVDKNYKIGAIFNYKIVHWWFIRSSTFNEHDCYSYILALNELYKPINLEIVNLN